MGSLLEPLLPGEHLFSDKGCFYLVTFEADTVILIYY